MLRRFQQKTLCQEEPKLQLYFLNLFEPQQAARFDYCNMLYFIKTNVEQPWQTACTSIMPHSLKTEPIH